MSDVESDDDIAYESSLGKGDQGDSGTCLRYALANALVNHAHKWYGMVLDVAEIAGSLINTFPHLDGASPDQYNKTTISVQTKDGSMGSVTLFIYMLPV